MVWLVLVPILAGIGVYKLPRPAARAGALLAQVPLAILTAWHWRRAHTEGTFFEILGGDSATLYVVLRGERTALALAALTVLLFAVSIAYCLRASYCDNRLLMLLLILQGLSMGVFLTDDIFNLFVLLEVASLVAVLLVMYRKNRRNTYDGLYYLLIQLVAMAFFLFGVAYLYRSFGVLHVTTITELIASGAVSGRELLLPLAMILTGVGLKAGLFPLFSYLPRSYGNPGAPSVMLLLMSAVLVKGALFWVYRLQAMFQPGLDASSLLLVVGLLTGLAGAAMALGQADIRMLLAYSTISQVGLITVAISAGAAAGAQLHLITHALAKSVLFLGAAIIIRRYGTGRLRDIRGVGLRMPLLTILLVVAAVSMVGMPLTAGAVSKGLIEAGAGGPSSAAVWAINVCTFLVMARLAVVLFGEPKAPTLTVAWRPVPDQMAVTAVLAIALLGVGFFAPQASLWVTGQAAPSQFWPSATKAWQFVLLAALAIVAVLLVGRLNGSPRGPALAERLRLPWTDTLSLPHAALALTVFFTGVVAWGTLVTRGGAS